MPVLGGACGDRIEGNDQCLERFYALLHHLLYLFLLMFNMNGLSISLGKSPRFHVCANPPVLGSVVSILCFSFAT